MCVAVGCLRRWLWCVRWRVWARTPRGEGNRGEPHAPAKPDSNHRDAARAPRAPRRHAAAEVQSMCSPRPPVGRRCISLQPPLRAAAPHSLGEPTRPARRKRRKGGASTTITDPKAHEQLKPACHQTTPSQRATRRDCLRTGRCRPCAPLTAVPTGATPPAPSRPTPRPDYA